MSLKMKVFRGLASALLILLAGCMQQAEMAATAESGSDAQPAFGQFPDIPVPPGSKLQLDRTLILGSGQAWMGQMVVNAPQGTFAYFDFLKHKMPEFGWAEMTSVRAPVSVLTYSRQGRIASIQIQARTIGGSEAIFTVSPHEGQAGAMSSMPAVSPSPAPAPVRPAPVAPAKPAPSKTYR